MTRSELIEAAIAAGGPVKIELGCGPDKKPGYIGIDMLQLPGVDIVASLEEKLDFIPDNSIDEVTSNHVLEHIEQFEQLMQEMHRILKPGGIKKVTVPHHANPYYYSDYTPRRFFGLYSFDYFTRHENQRMKLKVPSFYGTTHFECTKRRIIFKSPFYIQNLKAQVMNRLINSSAFLQERSEERYCFWFPCKELYFEITPVK
jgi:ubiquinone/menaquinone biosynthesis C-methylase UbiE